MKKAMSLLVAAAFVSGSGFAAAQATPAQSRAPSVQAAAGTPKAEVKARVKKIKTTRSKRAKSR